MNSNLESLINYFKDTYARFDLFFDKPEGAFVFSDLEIVNDFFTQLLQKKIINTRKTFLETGCGDGRVVALTSILNINSFGIELGEQLASEAIDNIETLYKDKILGDKPVIIQGDFLNSESYERLKKPFEDFNIIFNYHTEVEKLIQKVENESMSGTILILFLLRKKPLLLQAFDLVFTYVLKQPSNEAIFVYRKK